MKKITLLSCVLSGALLTAAAPSWAAPPAGFDARVEALRQSTGVPGMAIAIVEKGAVTLAQGYGVRKIGAAARVDADTIFPTGSTGKAITTAALAVLVDAGKIGWDDKVIDHLPGFQMYDPWVTREMTIRDLLVHRSGLGDGAGDLLFVPRSSLSRAETVRRVRYLKPATSFRSTFAYSNVMYVVAGQLIEAVSGQRWEEFVLDRVLKPAGMSRSTTDNLRNFATANRAYPHARMDGGLRGAGKQELLDERNDLGRNAAPAGGVASSANDLAKWLQVQLGSGTTPAGVKVFSKEAHAQMWTPTMLMPIDAMPPALKLAQPVSSSYGLGWDVTDYRGARLIWHGGAVLGFKTAVVMLPDQQVGFAITINSEDGGIVRGLMNELLDHYLGLPRADWPAVFRARSDSQMAEALALIKSAAAANAANAANAAMPAAGNAALAPVANSALAGTYADPWYGALELAERGADLTVNFTSTPRMTGTLTHWRHNTFVTKLDDPSIEPAYVTFALDPDGKVERITMKPVSPVADFSWDYGDLLFTPVKRAKVGP